VLDRHGDAIAQAGPKPPIGHEAQQLPRAPHEIGAGAGIRAQISH
jgi:hypothetical protein